MNIIILYPPRHTKNCELLEILLKNKNQDAIFVEYDKAYNNYDQVLETLKNEKWEAVLIFAEIDKMLTGKELYEKIKILYPNRTIIRLSFYDESDDAINISLFHIGTSLGARIMKKILFHQLRQSL